jgi:uncharacterized protein YgiM (DUF1202 family)
VRRPFASARRGSAGRRRWGRVFAIAAAALLLGTGPLVPVAVRAQEFDVSVDSIEELSGLTAVVAHSGNGVNLRAEPGQDGDVLDKLADGTVVALRIDEVDTVQGDDGIRWWPIRFDGQDGWIAGLYLDDAGGASPSDGQAAAPSLETPSFAADDYVEVRTDDGGGLNVRSGAGTDFERIMTVGNGDVLQVMDGPEYDGDGNGWYLVTDGDASGWAIAGFLVGASQPAAPKEEAAFGSGDYAAATTGVNIRHRGGLGSDVVGSIAEGGVVQVVGEPVWDDQGDAWYKIDAGDVRGYVLGDLMVASDAPAPPAPPAAPSGPTGRFIYPLANYVVTQGYGCTGLAVEPYDANLGCNFHNGIDLAAPAYSPIMAADGGVVVAAGWCDCGLGYYVEIDHGNGFSTVYGHMAEQPYVSVGQTVNQGDVIGPVGSTGASTGPHVHFMVKVNGSTVDPFGYL